jgi:hypothetical protein
VLPAGAATGRPVCLHAYYTATQSSFFTLTLVYKFTILTEANGKRLNTSNNVVSPRILNSQKSNEFEIDKPTRNLHKMINRV